MKKIDYSGGAHGNFLELMINLFVYQIDFNQSSFFNSNGACHTKDDDSRYHPVIRARHYSMFGIEFNSTDQVIEIHCNENDMLIALTNSLVRAGNETIDIKNLERSTIKKLASLSKVRSFINDLIVEHGEREHYPRSTIRNYFYSRFDCPEYGVDMFNTFKHTGSKHTFPFAAFFNLEHFYIELNKCAFFLENNFYPTERTVDIWNDFIKYNQGYHSQLKCQKVLHAILEGKDMIIDDLNLVEEAWILHRISKIFRCYDHPLLTGDNFITNTKEISQIVYEWKRGDYPSRPT